MTMIVLPHGIGGAAWRSTLPALAPASVLYRPPPRGGRLAHLEHPAVCNGGG